ALGWPGMAPATEQTPHQHTSAGVFGLDRIWSMHLTIPAKNWERMQPSKGGFPFGRPNERPKQKAPQQNRDRKNPRLFRVDFEYVKADVEIGGKTYKDVAVRFKGNAGYATSQGRLKRPFKIHLSRYVRGQNFHGLRKLTLNTNNMDPSAAREVLSYKVYRSLD